MRKNEHNSKKSIYVIDDNYKIVYYNDTIKSQYPELQEGMRCYEVLCKESAPCKNCPLYNEGEENEFFWNKWRKQWIKVDYAPIEWPNAGACTIIMANEVKENVKQLFLSLTERVDYSKMIALNLKNDSYRIIYTVNENRRGIKEAGNLQEFVTQMESLWVHPSDREIFREFLQKERMIESIRRGVEEELVTEFRKKDLDGRWYWSQLQLVPVNQHGESEGIIMCLVRDVSRQKNMAGDRKLCSEETIDSLTGLLRGKAFDRSVRNLLKKAGDTQYVMIAIDIAHFEMFREWFAIEEENEFLTGIAAQIKTAEEESGGVAGYFGENSFSILMPHNEQQIEQFQSNMLNYIKSVEKFAGFLPYFGVYIITNKDMEVSAIHNRAIVALTNARDKSYFGRASYFDEKMFQEIEEEHMIQLDVQRALNENEFVFYLQPQCRMVTGNIVGAEALVRWKHKDKGMISPGSFIPALEKNGYIIELDRYIWESVFKWQRSLIDRGIKPVAVSVNVSKVDLYFEDIAAFFCEMARKYQVSPELIEVELTESAYIEEFNEISAMVKKLQQAGFKVLMDDFGSGYSSLNMLKNINIDVLKLDMKFLDINQDSPEKGLGILESVVNMANLLKIPMISEGIETKTQMKVLMDMGCLDAQGYYFYRPIPVEEFEELLLEKNGTEDVEGY